MKAFSASQLVDLGILCGEAAQTAKSLLFGAQLSCKMSREIHLDCSVSARPVLNFYSKRCVILGGRRLNGKRFQPP